MSEYAEKIKKLRKEKGVTQAEAANEIGISIKTLYRYEHGRVKRYNHETVTKVAKFYGVSNLDIWKEINDEAE